MKPLLLLASLLFVLPSIAQKCPSHVAYQDLLSFFQSSDQAEIVRRAEAKCFHFYKKDGEVDVYVRDNKQDDMEYLYFKHGRLYHYSCTDLGVLTQLLKEIKVHTIYATSLIYLDDYQFYLLKDKSHMFRLWNAPNPTYGYIYDFEYQVAAESTMLTDFAKAKSLDKFPKDANERSRLEYRYTNVDSYDNVTSVVLSSGDRVLIEAEGEITLGTFAGNGGPDGIEGFTNYRIAPAFKHGSLLYRIGSGDWQLAGSSVTFVATNSGNLEFKVNDSDPSNNRGYFSVRLKIIRKSK